MWSTPVGHIAEFGLECHSGVSNGDYGVGRGLPPSVPTARHLKPKTKPVHLLLPLDPRFHAYPRLKNKSCRARGRRRGKKEMA